MSVSIDVSIPAGEPELAEPFLQPPDSALWDENDLAGLDPPEQLTPSEWAEKYRELKRGSSRLGPWTDENQPILRGIMDLCVRASVRELWIKKSGQVGVSEAVRNAIARDAHLDPCPWMYVLPNEKKGRDDVKNKLIPLFEDTDALAVLSTGRLRDKKLDSIGLVNGFTLRLAWAGSATATSGDPYKKVALDEVDKYAAPRTGQADAISEARTRILTYEDLGAKIIGNSTPSTEDGAIAQEYEACPIKLFYFVPCPHCGRFQQIVWDRIGYQHFEEVPDAKDRAAKIVATKSGWLECENPDCTSPDRRRRKKTDPDVPVILERYKRQMLLGGYWGTVSGGWKIWFDRSRPESGEQPEGDKIGIYVWRGYDLSGRWWKIAAAFVECDGNAARLRDFYKLVVGQEWKELDGPSPVASIFQKKCTADPETDFIPPPAQQIPIWASRLLMGVDTQKDRYYWVIRAFGPGFRSQRIDHGEAPNLQIIQEVFDGNYYRFEANPWGFQPQRCHRLGIDTGGGIQDEGEDASRTDKLYQWCAADPIRRLPLKGASKPFEDHIRWRRLVREDPRNKTADYEIVLWRICPLYWRDLLASYITSTVPAIDYTTGELIAEKSVDLWMLNDRSDDIYNRYMSNVKRSRVKSGRGHVLRWTPSTPGARHDYHDVETYLLAMAHAPGECAALPSLAQRIHHAKMQSVAAKPPSAGIKMPDGREFLVTNR